MYFTQRLKIDQNVLSEFLRSKIVYFLVLKIFEFKQKMAAMFPVDLNVDFGVKIQTL